LPDLWFNETTVSPDLRFIKSVDLPDLWFNETTVSPDLWYTKLTMSSKAGKSQFKRNNESCERAQRRDEQFWLAVCFLSLRTGKQTNNIKIVTKNILRNESLRIKIQTKSCFIKAVQIHYDENNIPSIARGLWLDKYKRKFFIGTFKNVVLYNSKSLSSFIYLTEFDLEEGKKVWEEITEGDKVVLDTEEILEIVSNINGYHFKIYC